MSSNQANDTAAGPALKENPIDCKWCGQPPCWGSGYNTHRVGCSNEDCPVNKAGIFLWLEQWNTRSSSVPAAANELVVKGLTAAYHTLRGYQYGNADPALAEQTADYAHNALESYKLQTAGSAPAADNSAFIYANTLKLAIEIAKNEKVSGETGTEDDAAYNRAIDDVIAELEKIASHNAPTVPAHSEDAEKRARELVSAWDATLINGEQPQVLSSACLHALINRIAAELAVPAHPTALAARRAAEKIADSHVTLTTPNHRNRVIAEATAIIEGELTKES